MKTEPTPVMAGDGGIYVLTLMKALSSNYRQPACAALGETLRSLDRTMVALRVSCSILGASFVERRRMEEA